MGKTTQHPTLRHSISRRLLAALVLFIGTGLLVICTNLPANSLLTKRQGSRAQGARGIVEMEIRSHLRQHSVGDSDPCSALLHSKRIGLFPPAPCPSALLALPPSPPKPHPLPPTLAQWEDNANSGDYFAQITPTQVGYLVWSQFPVRVYVEPPKAVSDDQQQVWLAGVLQAVQEWSIYLPLLVVEQPEVADIKIVRQAPPLQISPGDKIPRARSAQTSYELYSNNNVLSHRFTILLSPSQTGEYVEAATRHELGHALGIWGHSPLQTDALYFSQVRQPPMISPRDVNTLKLIYEQPTSLGWSVVDN